MIRNSVRILAVSSVVLAFGTGCPFAPFQIYDNLGADTDDDQNVLHSPYVRGARIIVFAKYARIFNTSETTWGATISDESVARVVERLPLAPDDESFHVAIEAVGPGETEIVITSEDGGGNELGKATISVDEADTITLYPAAQVLARGAVEDAEAGATYVAASDNSSKLLARYSAGDTRLYGNNVLRIEVDGVASTDEGYYGPISYEQNGTLNSAPEDWVRVDPYSVPFGHDGTPFAVTLRVAAPADDEALATASTQLSVAFGRSSDLAELNIVKIPVPSDVEDEQQLGVICEGKLASGEILHGTLCEWFFDETLQADENNGNQPYRGDLALYKYKEGSSRPVSARLPESASTDGGPGTLDTDSVDINAEFIEVRNSVDACSQSVSPTSIGLFSLFALLLRRRARRVGT
jgi:hypothetical protein